MTLPLSGIYKITNTRNGKVYVGQSKNVYKRRMEHFTALAHHAHPNKKMQHDWDINNRGFRWDIIELCPLSELNNREKYWIDKLDTINTGYNQDWVPYKRKVLSKPAAKKPYRKKRYPKTS